MKFSPGFDYSNGHSSEITTAKISVEEKTCIWKICNNIWQKNSKVPCWKWCLKYSKCCSGSKYQNWIYFCAITHCLWWWFYNNIHEDNKQTPRQLGRYFQNHCELPPEEFQFSIGKKWKIPTDRSEGDHKVHNNSPSDHTEWENSRSIKTNLSPQREQVRAINRQNNNSSSSMDRGR